MYHLIVCIIDDPDQSIDVLDAWEAAGAPGVTILESTGLARVRRSGMRDDLPLMPSLLDMLRGREEHHRTLMTVVGEDILVDKIIDATQSVLGDLDQPDSGFLFVVPVSRVAGLGRPAQNKPWTRP